MDFNVSLPEYAIQPLIEGLEKQISAELMIAKTAQERALAMQSTVDRLKEQLSKGRVGKTEVSPVLFSKPAGYNENWVWEKKITFVLNADRKPKSTSVIVDTLLDIEPKLRLDRAKVVRSISSILSQRINEDKIFYRVQGDRGWEYGLKDWKLQEAIEDFKDVDNAIE